MATIEEVQAKLEAKEAEMLEREVTIAEQKRHISKLNNESQTRRLTAEELQAKVDELNGVTTTYQTTLDELTHKYNPEGDPGETIDVIEQILSKNKNTDVAAQRTEISRLKKALSDSNHENKTYEGLQAEFDTFKKQTAKEKLTDLFVKGAIENNVKRNQLDVFTAYAEKRITNAELTGDRVLVDFDGESNIEITDAITKLATSESCSSLIDKQKGLGATRGGTTTSSFTGGEVDQDKFFSDPEYAADVEASRNIGK